MQSKVIPLDVIKHILELNHDLSTMREDNIPLSQISTYLRTKEREIKDKLIPNKKPKLQISINIDIPEKEANSIISYIRFIYDRNSLIKDIYDMLSESSLNIQDINKVIDIVRSKF